jgi:hypothetical protein
MNQPAPKHQNVVAKQVEATIKPIAMDLRISHTVHSEIGFPLPLGIVVFGFTGWFW